MSPEEQARQQGFEAGRRHAALMLSGEVIRQLAVCAEDGYHFQVAKLLAERAELINTLRTLCEEDGDNDWADNLSLSDVVEKHLWRPMRERWEDADSRPGID